MPVLHLREIEPYQPGTDTTDVIINEVHMNRTALTHYNYTLYSNGTLSNGTNCYLAFQSYQPYLVPANGSFVNGTSCYAPIHPVGRHAAAGMTFAILFVLSIIVSIANLHKTKTRHLPVDKRWASVGHHSKWCWLLGLEVCGAIASFMSIDVDRDHVQSTPLVLQSVFYTLLLPLMMAAVWGAVRNWATWKECQIINQDPLAFSSSDATDTTTPKTQDRLLPLVFYLFTLITFLLAIARTWATIELQRDPQQQALRAEPFATDSQFRASGVFALLAFLVIVYSLGHSVYRYRLASPVVVAVTAPDDKRKIPDVKAIPPQLIISLLLLLVKIAYAIAASFSWPVSPLRFGLDPAWIYGLGYTPVLLLVLLNTCGLCKGYEDKVQQMLTEVRSAGISGRRAAVRLWMRTPWAECLGRLLGRRTASASDVEMDPIVKDRKTRKTFGSSTVSVPVPEDSQAGGHSLMNPFSSGASFNSWTSRDSMDFVKDVLSSLQNIEYH